MNKLDYPQIVIYPGTLPILKAQVHLWEYWGPGITKHYLNSPIVQYYDELQVLDFIRGNKN